jgi:hypothetical protein
MKKEETQKKLTLNKQVIHQLKIKSRVKAGPIGPVERSSVPGCGVANPA